MEIQSLYQIKFIVDLIDIMSLITIISLISHMLIRFILYTIINGKDHQFRINKESIYSIAKLIHETLYALSVSVSIILLILLINVNIMITSSTAFLGSIIKWDNIFTILGAGLLIILGLPFRIFYTGRNWITWIIDLILLIIPLLLLILGIIFGSISHFNYLI